MENPGFLTVTKKSRSLIHTAVSEKASKILMMMMKQFQFQQ